MPHVFEIGDVLKVLQAAKARNQRDWLMICVTFLHALRASETVALKRSNIVGDKLKVKRLKNSNPVEDELVEHENPLLNERKALFDLCLNTHGNQRLFPITSRTFQRKMHLYGELAGLPKLYCHPHTLKHSVLDYLREKMPLEELQDRSGHKSLDSLRIYLHPKKSIVDSRVRAALGSIAV